MKTSVKDVESHEMVVQLAAFLKKSGKVKVPEWSDLVKLGKHNELAPSDPDWYFIRCAAIARRLYIRAPTGMAAFRKIFGGHKRRGTAPGHFVRCFSGNIRKALQTLEAIKWVEKAPTGKGRVLSKQGRKDLDRIANQIRASNPPKRLV